MTPPPSFVELCEAQQENKISNVIGTVIDALPPTTSRKGDHMLTFTLDDGTLQRGQKCRLFAKKANELPQINGLGDVVILKRVRYSFVSGTGLLSSVFGSPSPWTVFHYPIPKELGIFGANPEAVRYQMPAIGTEEMQYVISLGQTQDHHKFTPLNDEVLAKVTAVKPLQKCDIKDLVIDTYSRIVGEVVKVFFNYERATLYITDYTENQLLYNYGTRTENDQNEGISSRWPGPPGKYTLLVECWPPHSHWIRENVSTGNFIQLDNVHIKSNPDHGRTEGALHGSKVNEDRLKIRRLEVHDVADLLYRKEKLGWADGFDKKNDESNDEQSKAQLDKSSKKRTRNQRKKDKAEREAKRAKSMPDSETEEQPKKPIPRSSPAFRMTNENVRCENGSWSHRSISEIRDMSRSQNTAAEGKEAAAHLTSFATVRVVDFKPNRLEDFAKARDMTLEEQQAAQHKRSMNDSAEDSDSDSSGAHSESSIYNNSTQVRRQIWEWKFALLLEDASASSHVDGKADASQIVTYITNADAEYLLGMKALDLRRNKQTLNRLRETMFILWGDLEERKEQKEARMLAEVSANASSAGSSGSSQNNAVASRPFRCIIEECGDPVNSQVRRKFYMKGTTIVRSSIPAKQDSGRLISWDEVDENDIDQIASEGQAVRAPRAG